MPPSLAFALVLLYVGFLRWAFADRRPEAHAHRARLSFVEDVHPLEKHRLGAAPAAEPLLELELAPRNELVGDHRRRAARASPKPPGAEAAEAADPALAPDASSVRVVSADKAPFPAPSHWDGSTCSGGEADLSSLTEGATVGLHAKPEVAVRGRGDFARGGEKTAASSALDLVGTRALGGHRPLVFAHR